MEQQVAAEARGREGKYDEDGVKKEKKEGKEREINVS